MTSNLATPTPALEVTGQPVVKIIGVGTAGVSLLETLSGPDFDGATLLAVHTESAAHAACIVGQKLLLAPLQQRGLGTGGDAARGNALAEEHFARLKEVCAGANVILLVAGLGGGTGSGITPVLARAARETGALVLAFVTLPFDYEANRRRDQARKSMESLKQEADGVICLPSQKATKLMDENTCLVDTFRITGGLLTEAIRGVWQLLTRPGLIQIHLADLCSVVRDKNSEGVFAFVEASGPTRAREVIEKILAHPLLDEGRALNESDSVLISLMAGRDLTMAEVNKVMEQISRQCERAQIIMGAAVDENWKNRLAVTVIAARHNQPVVQLVTCPPAAPAAPAAIELADFSAVRSTRPSSRPAPDAAFLRQREQLVRQHSAGGRRRGGDVKLTQEMLPLVTIHKGRFDKCEPTIVRGQDMDVPTYFRRNVPLN